MLIGWRCGYEVRPSLMGLEAIAIRVGGHSY